MFLQSLLIFTVVLMSACLQHFPSNQKELETRHAGNACYKEEIAFLNPVECVGLNNDGQLVDDGGYCYVEAYHDGEERIEKSPSIDILKCEHGHWSGTDSTVGLKRERRFLGFIWRTVKKIFCFIFCSDTNAEPVIRYPPKFASCKPPEVKSNYIAAAGGNRVTVNWKEPTATDSNGQQVSVTQTSGGKTGGYFEGAVGGKTHHITYQAKDKDGLTQHCYFEFTVTILTCGNIPFLNDGRRNCNYENKLGSACTYTCNTGYEPIGSATIKCEGGASPAWSRVPECIKQRCKAPSAPTDGSIHCDNQYYEYGTICSFSCRDGLKVQGQPYIKCIDKKRWNDITPTCVDITPPVISCITPQTFYADRGLSTTSVTWKVPSAKDNYDPNPRVIKREGVELGDTIAAGSTQVIYMAVDALGNESPNCSVEIRVEEIICGHPLGILNSTYISARCSLPRYTFGNQCNLSCLAHLPLEGADVISCETAGDGKGFWDWGNGTEPSCKEIACPPLDPPVNGALVKDTILTRPVYTVMCNEKFDIPDMGRNFSGMMFCVDDGTWSPFGSAPDCIEPRSPRTIRLPAEIFFYGGDCGTNKTMDEIRKKFQEILSSGLKPFFNVICPPGETCKAENVKITCGPIQHQKKRSLSWTYKAELTGKRRTYEEQPARKKRKSRTHVLVLEFYITVEMNLEGQTIAEAVKKYDDLQIKTLKPLVQAFVNSRTFDIQGFDLDEDSFRTPAYGELACSPGYKLDRTSCKPCPLGFWLDERTSECTKCPVGQYKDKEETLSCSLCPDGHSTKFSGAKSQEECSALCKPGCFSPDRVENCSACQKGFYQEQSGQTSCLRCPSGTSTISTNSSSRYDCKHISVFIRETNGEVTVSTMPRTVEKFTLMFWVKLPDDTRANTTFYLSSKGVSILEIWFIEEIFVAIPFVEVKTFGRLSNKYWSYVVVIADASERKLEVYVNENQDVVYVNDTSPFRSIHGWNEFRIASSSELGIFMTGLHLVEGTLLSSEHLRPSSCHMMYRNDLMNMTLFEDLRVQGISVTTSSECDATDKCRNLPCNGHICTNEENNYTCTCLYGWSGFNCDVPPDYCLSSQCKNGATCHSTNSSYFCECMAGYSGIFCEIVPVDGSWSDWSEWSQCSKSCGSGITVRVRACDNPPPGTFGKNCTGDSSEHEVCNAHKCPECSPFQRKYGTIADCTTDEKVGNQNCTLTCKEGTTVPPGESGFQEFYCGPGTNYKWSPMEYTLPCVGPVGPRKLEITSTVEYSRTLPVEKQKDISAAIFKNLNSTECDKSSNCKKNITFINSTRRKRKIGSAVNLILDVPLRLGPDLKLDDYLENGIVSDALEELIDAIVSLELTAQYIQNYTTDVFDVTVDDVTYNVETDSLAMEPTVTCDSGQIAIEGTCVECPSGSFLKDSQCRFCERGTYQPTAGQAKCIQCPEGMTTDFIGASDEFQCIVEPKRTEETTTVAEESDDLNEGILVIVIIVPVTVILAIAAVVFFWHYRRNRLGRHPGEFAMQELQEEVK